MDTREQIGADLTEIQTRLKRARAHGDVDQIEMLLLERNHLLDRILELRYL